MLIAYSGGMDSSFLLKVAKDILNENVLAVTADSEIYSSVETESARKFAADIGVNHIVVKTNELKNKEFVKNSPDRCFHCKLSLYGEFIKIAEANHIKQVIDGINFDDKNDFRPGMSAATKLKIRSPLLEAGLTKDDISNYSKKMNLPTWNKLPNPCLSTRFPYGTALTKENLSKVEQAEIQLRHKRCCIIGCLMFAQGLSLIKCEKCNCPCLFIDNCLTYYRVILIIDNRR